MYDHTQDIYDEIIQRALENTAPSVPVLSKHYVKRQGEHNHSVVFIYHEDLDPFVTIETVREFNGKTWNNQRGDFHD